MKRFTVFATILFLGCMFFAFAKEGVEGTPKFIKMMKDPKVNFFDVKKEADNYFKDRDKGRGSGWKQYKRWEYFWGERLYPSGDRTNLADPAAEMASFTENYLSIQAANWICLGPSDYQNITGHWSPGLGRINDIQLDPVNSNIIYVGTPSGGLWRSTTGGNSWTPLTDSIPAIGVSCILIDPSNTNVIYIGTGDRDAYDCWSRGVLKSTDGGTTWNTTGLTFVPTDWQKVHKMLMHPTSYNTIFAATYYGLYKSTNGAVSFTKVLDGDVDDIEFKPGTPATMYAVTNEVPSPIFYRSTNSGDTWTATSMTATRRAQIAVTPANANYVYFFSKDKGLYLSTNSGTSWTRKGRAPTEGSQDWYDLAIAVSPTNVNEVHAGEIESYVSLNCGKSWTKTSVWSYPNTTGYIHCDIHEMQFFGNTLYIGSDGLITTTTDQASSFTDLSVGLINRQFYRMASGVPTNPYKLMGGSQDNGTSVYSTNYWHEWLGADGMECVIDYTNENIVYGTVQYGQFYKSTTGGTNTVSISQPGGGDWITPFVIDPINHNTLYMGNTSVRKTTNAMSSWTTIGTFGDTGAYINAMAIAKTNPSYIYASKGSRIWRTTNGGGAWTEITGTLPGYKITSIAVHPTNPLKIAVTESSFWTYAAGQKVYTSADAGSTWINYSANLPNLPANSVVYEGGSNDAMYVGMDVGVYYRDNTMPEWVSFMTNLPNVMIDELEVDANAGKIRAATYGRGLWESPLYGGTFQQSTPPTPATGFDRSNISRTSAKTTLTLALNPDNSQLLITHPGYNGSVLIRIYNSSDSLVKKVMHNGNKVKRVDISNLPAGRYAAVLTNGQGETIKEFEKK